MSHILLNTQATQENTFRSKGVPLPVKELILPNRLLNSTGELISERPDFKGHLNKSSGEPTTKYKNTTEFICLVFSFIAVASIGVAWISSLLIIAHH